MQGKYGSENKQPLSELLTVVLITHNRPAFFASSAAVLQQPALQGFGVGLFSRAP